MSEFRVWIVAAGTGGHIFPGVEIAKNLSSQLAKGNRHADLHFFGSAERLEARILPEMGFKLHLISAKPWMGKGIFSRILALFSLAMSCLSVLRIAMSTGRPDIFIGVGGYVSMPVALVARMLGAKVFLHEPNIKTGVANRMISRFASLCTTTNFSDAPELLSCPVKVTGNPVRKDFHSLAIQDRARTILVLGGSQGAKILCEAGFDILGELLSLDRKLNLILQSGASNYEMSKAIQKRRGLERRSHVLPFVKDLPALLEKADIVLARAGAMTLAELSVAGLPVVLVPYPHAADDHQRVNARLLEKANAARVVDEKQPNFKAALSTQCRDLLFSSDQFRKRLELGQNIKKFAHPEAAKNICGEILSKSL